MATPFVPGMGTHHIRGGITPAMLNDPSFDKDNPILDDAGLDDQFVPSRPEVLQYDGNGPTAKLVGFDYYVRTDTGQPPAGFEGNNDWWHIHPKICFRKTDAAMVGFNTSDASCTGPERHQREHGELLHAPRLGARRHEVHPRRVRRHDPVHHGRTRRRSTTRTTRATSPAARVTAMAHDMSVHEG